jgi:hypothetical protein
MVRLDMTCGLARGRSEKKLELGLIRSGHDIYLVSLAMIEI